MVTQKQSDNKKKLQKKIVRDSLGNDSGTSGENNWDILLNLMQSIVIQVQVCSKKYDRLIPLVIWYGMEINPIYEAYKTLSFFTLYQDKRFTLERPVSLFDQYAFFIELVISNCKKNETVASYFFDIPSKKIELSPEEKISVISQPSFDRLITRYKEVLEALILCAR